MKRLISLVLIALLAFAATSCSVFGPSYQFDYSDSEYYTAGEGTVEDGSALSNIFIYWYSGSVTLETHTESTIIIEETVVGTSESDKAVHYWYEVPAHTGEGSLIVQFGKSGVKDYEGVKKDLKVIVPENQGYHISVTTDSADVNLSVDSYKNTVRKLSVSSETGNIHANVYSVGIVQISGCSIDPGDGASRVYELHAKADIDSLGMNSSYASVVISADEVGSMGAVGSVFCETHFTVNKAGDIKISCVAGTTYIKVLEFDSMDLKMREKPVYISIPADTEFKLVKTLEKIFDGEEDKVSDVIDIGFDSCNKISDTEYVVGDGSKTINVLTYNEIHIDPIE